MRGSSHDVIVGGPGSGCRPAHGLALGHRTDRGNRDQPADDFDEVAVKRISTGSSFAFEPRPTLPITPL